MESVVWGTVLTIIVLTPMFICPAVVCFTAKESTWKQILCLWLSMVAGAMMAVVSALMFYGRV